MNLTHIVAREHIADLHREAAAGRLAAGALAVARDHARRARTRRRSLARTLRNHGMPLDEVRALLGAKDPLVVTRYMELHRERLAEHLLTGSANSRLWNGSLGVDRGIARRRALEPAERPGGGEQ